MLSSLVLAAALLGQGELNIQIQIPQQQYQQQYQQQVQPRITYYVQPRLTHYIRPQPVIQLRPGDLLIPQRVGLFGFRTELKLYRRGSRVR